MSQLKKRLKEALGRKCGKCGSTTAACPECGREYAHGTASQCSNPPCKQVNAPLDCSGCGFVVSDRKDGVLNHSMKLIPYK